MFQGFSTPNYVQVPHEFFDIILEKDMDKSANNRGVSKSAIKVLAFMIRYTFGWQRAGFSLQCTFKDIMEHANMQKQQVNDGIKQCLENEWIERKEINGEMYYRLKLKDNDIPWELEFDWKSRAPRKEERYENHTRIERYENHTENQYENHTDHDMKIIPGETPSDLGTSESMTLLKKKDKESIKEKVLEREREGATAPSSNSESDLEKEYQLLEAVVEKYYPKEQTRGNLNRLVDPADIWRMWRTKHRDLTIYHVYAAIYSTYHSPGSTEYDATGIIIKRLDIAQELLIPIKQAVMNHVYELKRRILPGKLEA